MRKWFNCKLVSSFSVTGLLIVYLSLSSIAQANQLRQYWVPPKGLVFTPWYDFDSSEESNAASILASVEAETSINFDQLVEDGLRSLTLSALDTTKPELEAAAQDVANYFDVNKDVFGDSTALGLLSTSFSLNPILASTSANVFDSVFGKSSGGPSEVQIMTQLVLEAINANAEEIQAHIDTLRDVDLHIAISTLIADYRDYFSPNPDLFTAGYRLGAYDAGDLGRYTTSVNKILSTLNAEKDLHVDKFAKRMNWWVMAVSYAMEVKKERSRFAILRGFLNDNGLTLQALTEEQKQLAAYIIEEGIAETLRENIGKWDLSEKPTPEELLTFTQYFKQTLLPNDEQSIWRKAHDTRFSDVVFTGMYYSNGLDKQMLYDVVDKYFSAADKSLVNEIEKDAINESFIYYNKVNYEFNYKVEYKSFPQYISVYKISSGLYSSKPSECLMFYVVKDIYGEVLQTYKIHRPNTDTFNSSCHPDHYTNKPTISSISKARASHVKKTYPLFVQDVYGPIRQMRQGWAIAINEPMHETFLDTIYEEWSTVFDSDSDGLSNAIEQNIGTKIANRDSDSDGIDDGFEYKTVFLDPLNVTGVNDAQLDQDGDGFENLEEYRWHSRLDDPTSTPETVKTAAVMVAVNSILLN